MDTAASVVIAKSGVDKGERLLRYFLEISKLEAAVKRSRTCSRKTLPSLLSYHEVIAREYLL